VLFKPNTLTFPVLQLARKLGLLQKHLKTRIGCGISRIGLLPRTFKRVSSLETGLSLSDRHPPQSLDVSSVDNRFTFKQGIK
jgi:hypothetical protein